MRAPCDECAGDRRVVRAVALWWTRVVAAVALHCWAATTVVSPAAISLRFHFAGWRPCFYSRVS